MEFDSIYDPVEYTHLTPPQTPPEITKTFAEQQVCLNILINPLNILPKKCLFQFNCLQAKSNGFSFATDEFSHTYNHQPSNSFSSTPVKPESKPVSSVFHEVISNEEMLPIVFDENDLDRELALVEDLLRCRSKDQSDYNVFDDDSFHGSTSQSSSCPVSPRSDTSFSESKTSHDDEWYPESKTSVKRKTKPYSRTTEDRKSRKKEQNKNAATRYRQKKKQEVEEILGEEKVLRDKNKSLQSSYKDIKRETNYLKNLLRELYLVKGGLNN